MDCDGSIWQEFVSFFRSSRSTNVGGDKSFALLHPPSLVTNEENKELIMAASVEEIRRMLCSIAKDKVLGPYDFFPLIFRRYWPIIQAR